MKKILKRIGEFAAVPVYLAAMAVMGVVVAVLAAVEARRRRKLAEKRER